MGYFPSVFLCFLIATCWSSVAIAADWKLLADDPKISLEFDGKILQTRDGLVEARFRFNHSTPQISNNAGRYYRSAIVHSIFNCKEKKYAPYKRFEFDGENGTGAEINRLIRSGSDVVFYDPVPDSMAQIMFDQVCPLKASVK